MSSRAEKILSCIDVNTQTGIEIGALMSPIVTHEMGKIRYIDHATTEELKIKYKDDPNVDIDKIVEVNYVWGENKLIDLVGNDAPFDYLVASHVVEHVPDFIGWINEIHAILKIGGILSLAIPDKRYCFDYYRQNTTTGEVLDSFLRQSRKPSPKQTFDGSVQFVTCNGKIAWDYSEDITNAKFDFPNSEQEVWQRVYSAFLNDQYIDSHCWVFTPESFLDILRSLVNLNLLNFTIESFYPTSGCEFHVSLKAIDMTLVPLVELHNIQLNSIDNAIRNVKNTEAETLKLLAEIPINPEKRKFQKIRNQLVKLKKILRLN